MLDLFLIILFSGCANTVSINVNAIVDHELEAPGKRYVLSRGSNGESDDLYFKEFSRYFEHILTNAGYTKTENRDEADMEIFFKYGISDGRTGIYSYTTPIYDFVGGDSIIITEQSTNGSGQQRTTTVHIPARLERIGTAVETRGYTVYNRSAVLEARSLKHGAAKDKSPVLWNVFLYSVGESNDLRSIMPFMAAAAAPFVGKNSGQQVSVTLKLDDPLVMQLRSTLAP